MSHEWPLDIYQHGNVKQLLREKPFFAADIASSGRGIGSRALKELLESLQPKLWFAAHMHVAFSATVHHQATECDEPAAKTEVKTQAGSGNQAELTDATEPREESNTVAKTRQTDFFALDKCGVRRKHLSIFNVDLAADHPQIELEYDPEWLAIVRAHNPFMNLTSRPTRLPDRDELDLPGHVAFVRENIAGNSLTIPGRWTVPVHLGVPRPARTTLKQTAAFCKLLGMRDYWNLDVEEDASTIVVNDDEIVL